MSKAAAAKRAAKDKEERKDKKDSNAVKAIFDRMQAVFEKRDKEKAQSTAPTELSLSELKEDMAALAKPIADLIQLQRVPDPDAKADARALKTERFKRFREWMLAEAPDCQLGKLFEFDPFVAEGSGVRALVDLPKDSQFISVPRKLVMSTETMRASAIGPVVDKDRMCQQMPSLALSLHLMFESLDPKSYWRPYIDVLPRTFTLPMFYSAAELAELQSSPTLLDVLNLQKGTLRQYMYFWRLFKQAGHLGLPSFSYEQFLWAVAAVMSRQNSIPSKQGGGGGGRGDVLALIPGWDMCNGKNGSIATFFDVTKDENQSSTMEDVKKGDQIYIYYGERPNSKLFIFSGFVTSDNTVDSYQFMLSLDDSARNPLAKMQSMLLGRVGLRSPCGFMLPIDLGDTTRGEDGSVSQTIALMRFLRVMALNKDECGTVLKLTQDAAKSQVASSALDQILNWRNEIAAWELLQARLAGLLAEYATSLQDDHKILVAASVADAKAGGDAKADSKAEVKATDSGARLSENARWAVRMRVCEKTLLSECLGEMQGKLRHLRELQMAAGGLDVFAAKPAAGAAGTGTASGAGAGAVAAAGSSSEPKQESKAGASAGAAAAAAAVDSKSESKGSGTVAAADSASGAADSKSGGEGKKKKKGKGKGKL